MTKILIIDDVPENLEIVEKILTEHGYEVQIALNGKEGIEYSKETLFDLFLIDVRMPELDGFETYNLIKEHAQNLKIPALFFIAKTDYENIPRVFEQGGVDIITKPFHKVELLARVKSHIKIHEQRQQLIRLSATKDKLFSIIGHDLGGPLGSLKSLIEYMISDFDLADKKSIMEFLQLMQKSANSSYGLLENLLAWAKSQRDEIVYVPEKIKLNEIVFLILDLFAELIKNKKITIVYNGSENTTVFADKNMLMTVLRNLISNAIKFTPNGKQIQINVEKNDSEHVITIKDEGTGIPPENLLKLFKYTEHLSTFGTNGEKGSGLGLLLCKDFIEKHNGQIWVESEIGKGSEFKFTIPLCNN